MGNYLAFGRVYPERTSLHLEGIEDSNGRVKISFDIKDSQVFIRTNKPDNVGPRYLRNILQEVVEKWVDVIGFLDGVAFTVEITGLFSPDGDEWLFENQVGCLRERNDEKILEEYLDKIWAIYEAGEGEHLRRSLRDIRIAIRDSSETGFACYRAIESIRKHIHLLKGIPEEEPIEGWNAMHEEIETNKEDIKKIKDNYADERRHGGLNPVSGVERNEIFGVTQEAILRYIDYLYQRLE